MFLCRDIGSVIILSYLVINAEVPWTVVGSMVVHLPTKLISKLCYFEIIYDPLIAVSNPLTAHSTWNECHYIYVWLFSFFSCRVGLDN